MLLGQADLFKKVSKLELKELKGSKFYPAFLSKLEALLLDVYASLLPTASDYEQRKQLIQAYNMIVRSIFGNTGGFPVVEAFGSFVMDIFTAQSDLDLSINFNNTNASCFPRDQVVIVLRRLAKVLYKKQRKGHLSGVVPVLHARVPVLKAVDCNTGIECDISVENKDGISRSLFFSIISSIDERFRIISYLMKAWAKANDINSSKDLTMNSLSIISLVAFHFQTRDPPILPPFSKLLRDGTDITNICNVVLAFKNFGVRNKESVAELFVALLAKLSSVEKLWELGLCASIFEGSWISKTWGSKVGNMSIEDFLDRSQNFARSVGKIQMTKINACLQGTLDHLSRSMQDQTELSVLRSALFGPISFDPHQTNRIESIAAKIIKQKLPIQSVHPIIDIGDKGNNNHAKRRKQTRSDSAQPHAYTLPTNHSSRSTATTLNQKLPSNEPVDPLIYAITHTNQASSSSTKILEQKLPSIESRQPHIRRITQKRTRYAEAPSFGAHQNQSTSYLYPALPYVSPQPINLIGHPHVSFDPSGHPSHGYPKQPIYANSGHGPRQNHLIYASQLHPTVPVRPAYGSQGPLYYPNPVLPIFPGQTVPNTRNPRHFVPSRWFGSDHL